MKLQTRFSPAVLDIEAPRVAQDIEASIRESVFVTLKRKGAVVGLSGGVDSSVTAALCVRALGRERVLGLLLPEEESSEDSLRLGQLVADQLRIRSVCEDVTPLLRAARCYERRDAAIRSVIPEYGKGYKCKLVLPDLTEQSGYPIYSVVVSAPEGTERRARLTGEAYLGILAASNLKQRTRKMIEYFYADLHQYAVVGTPNRLEYDQGFFVKNGDGAADLKPIAHLYKSQVYRLAEYLEVPGEIRERPPTTDTFPLQQSQEEFFFSLPCEKMDLCLYGRNHGIPPAEVASAGGLTLAEAENAYRMIDSKRKATRYLHLRPLLAEIVEEIPA